MVKLRNIDVVLHRLGHNTTRYNEYVSQMQFLLDCGQYVSPREVIRKNERFIRESLTVPQYCDITASDTACQKLCSIVYIHEDFNFAKIYEFIFNNE